MVAGTDCDDADTALNPATPWYRDADSDGFGDAEATTTACEQPSGYLSWGLDCDDADASVSPLAYEVCNGVDDDCDGSVDDQKLDIDWYADLDGDGYGDPDNPADYFANSAFGDSYVALARR